MQLLWIMILSAVPILEQKAAIPAGLALGYPDVTTYLVTLVGALIPAPFIILFLPKIFGLLRKLGFGKIVDWYEAHALKRGKNIVTYELLGLFMFVAIPLPGTGVWTGSAVAGLLRIDFKKAFPTVVLGAAACGAIIMLVAKGLFSLPWLHLI